MNCKICGVKQMNLCDRCNESYNITYKIEEKHVTFEESFNKLIQLAKRVSSLSCCICCNNCIACDAIKILREFGEDK